MYCNNCGKKIPDDARFCTGCGTKINERTFISQIEKDEVKKVEKKDLKAQNKTNKNIGAMIICIIAGLTLIGVGSFAVIHFMNKPDSETSYSDNDDDNENTDNDKNLNENNADKNEEHSGMLDSDYEEENTYNEKNYGGKVLNIYCWNNEFQLRVTDHYYDYERIDEVTGKIGDVTVNWIMIPLVEKNAYRDALDAALMNQDLVGADEKVDIFLVDADFAYKYVDSDLTVDVSELGIDNIDIADQYKYTQDIMTDSDGKLKGLTWQGCPGLLFYNRDACKEVWGTDDPDDIQVKVKDWDTFLESAAEAKEMGYQMVSSVNDTYRVYANNVSSEWVVDGKINIDANIKKWVDDSMKMVENGYAGTHALWSDDWSDGFYPDGKVICYFGPAWLINYCMAADRDGSISNTGGWGATEGPQGFFWGGTWICAATGTDNYAEIRDIMLALTTDATVMKGIVEEDDDFVNNKTAMNEMASSDYLSMVLGGMNPLSMYCESAENISCENITIYDLDCNELFKETMKEYFEGNITYGEALDEFYSEITDIYPWLLD